MNEMLGWTWITLGFLSGFLLGLGFLREGFLGGYDSPRRRLLRLGHISFFGLGGLNILFALTEGRLRLEEPWLAVASAALAVGALAMPLACALVAWTRRFYPLFGVPVASLLTGGALVIWGLTP